MKAAPAVAPDVPPAAAESLAQQTHAVLSEACGRCHIGRWSEQPAALAIFDLDDPDWIAGISDEGLESIPERMDATGLEQEKVDAVVTYVSEVFAARASAAPPEADCA